MVSDGSGKHDEGDGPGDGDAELCPHRGAVFLDTIAGGQQVVTNAKTLERYKVTSGVPLALDFDDDGYGYLYDPAQDDSDILWLEDCFKFLLYRREDGSEVMVSQHQMHQGQHVEMSDFKAKFVESTATLTFGPFKKECKVQVALWKHPRHGARVFLSMKDVYNLMGLDQFKGDSWRWIHSSRGSWLKLFATFQLPGHLHLSAHCSGKVDTAGECQRILPFNGITPHALALLCARWADMNERKGGFRAPEHKLVAGCLLDYLVGLILLASPVVLELDLVENWRNVWPRPQTAHNPTRLNVGADGFCDFGEWRMLAEQQGKDSFAYKALEHAIPMVGRKHKLRDLLRVLGEAPKFASLLVQLVWQLGGLLHSIFEEALKGKKFVGLAAEPVQIGDLFACRSKLDARLLKHIFSCRSVAEADGCQHISLCSDKSAAGGFSLQASLLVLPNNRVLVPPPQVTRSFDCAIAAAKKPSETQAAKEDLMRRHGSWAKRSSSTAGFTTWRPQKRFRLGAKKVAQNLDNQVRQITGVASLSFYKKGDESARDDRWSDWRNWPHIALSLDQGSDNVAAYWWLQSENICCSVYWDWSHGCQNDWKAMVKQVDMWSFWILLIVVYNAPCGPLQDRTRWQQLQEAWDSLFGHFSPATSPLYEAKSKEILDERGGVASLDLEGRTVDEALWVQLKNDPPFVCGEQKVNLTRFFSSVARSWEYIEKWHSALLNYEYLALEAGMLTSGKIKKIVVREDPPENDETARGSTDARRPQLSDKTLRNACVNAVELAVAMLGEPEHNIYVRVILQAGAEVEAWHRYQAHYLRSVDASVAWMLQQLKGGFMGSLTNSLRKLGDCQVLLYCRIRIRDLENKTQASFAPLEIVREDDFCRLLAECIMAMVGKRAQRCIYAFRGWPIRMTGLLGDAQHQDRTLQEFKKDLRAYEVLSSSQMASPSTRRLLDRSVFRQTSVRQYVEAVKEMEHNPGCLEDLKRVVKLRSSAIISSQASEDSFNLCKNNSVVKGKKNHRRPEKMWAVMLSGGVGDKIHKYAGVEHSVPIPAQSVTLKREVFAPDPKKCSMKVEKLCSTKQKAPWYAPPAVDFGRNHADAAVLREVLDRDAAGTDLNLWLNRLVDSRHNLLLRRKSTGQWGFALCCFSDSAAVLWPALERVVPEHNAWRYFEFDMSASDFDLIVVWDVSEWEAAAYHWRSPVWQQAHMPNAKLPPAVRAIVGGPNRSLLDVAALHGFWRLEMGWLQDLARLQGVELPRGGSLCDVVAKLVASILGGDDDSALDSVGHRVGLADESTQYFQELLELDDVHDMLDRHDVKAMDDLKESAARGLEDRSRFIRDFGTKMAARAKKAAKGKRVSKKAAKGEPLPDRMPIATEVKQADAAKYCPPGGSIWLANFEGSWQAHYKPFRRISRSFSRWGEAEALRQCMVYLWSRHCEYNGIPKDQCPMAGVLDSERIVLDRSGVRAACSTSNA